MTAIVTHGNALSLHLPDESIDLIVTSPPYWSLRSYQDGGAHYEGQVGDEDDPIAYLDRLLEATAEWARVLKPGGSIFVNLGDKFASYEGNRGAGKLDQVGRPTRPAGSGLTGAGLARNKSLLLLPQRYAIRCMDELGLIVRQEIVWSKPNGMPESVTDRARRAHEQVWHLTKQPRYFSSVDEIREPHAKGWTPGQNGGHARAHLSRVSAGMATAGPHAAGALPGSVWTIPTAPLKVPDELEADHFAAFPPELVSRIVLGWSPRGGVVLDPFGGTGTTALVASVLGRTGISVDLSLDYCRIARWRTTDPGERARVIGAERPAPLPAGQGDLFDGLLR